MGSLCGQCGARCCRYFCFEIDKPRDYEAFENIRWYLLHEGVTVHVDRKRWYISIDNPCKAIGPDGRCTIYENRPMICGTYEADGCDASGGDYEYEEFFSSPQQIQEYARRTLGEGAFERARAGAQGPRKQPATGAPPTRARAAGKLGAPPRGRAAGRAGLPAQGTAEGGCAPRGDEGRMR